MGKKYTQEYVKALLQKEGFLLLGTYESSHKKVLMRCPFGHETEKTLSNLLIKKGCCSLCRSEKISKLLRTPFDAIIKMAKDKGIELITTKEYYEQNHKGKFKLEFLCKCGKIQKKSISRFKVWKECFSCNHFKNSIELTDFSLLKQYVKNNGYELLSTEYKNSKSHLIIKCQKHGGWNAIWSNIRNGHWCPKCAGINRSLPKKIGIQIIKEELEKIEYTLLSTEYQNNKGPITVQCPNGHSPWSTIWNSIDQGQRCPKCSANESKPQKEIFDFIKSIYNGIAIENDRKILEGKELDIWLPELKIGIEYDGLFSHSEYYDESNKKKGKKIKKITHIEKMRLIKNSGITFLAFYGDEWENKRSIVKSIIKNKIGVIYNKIYARKTDFVEITNKEAKEFLDANHLEGHVNCTKAFGLKYNEQLVMVMSFRKTMKNEHEIARMATLIDYVVVGGASKMLAHAPRPLVSYSNNRISNGEVYDGIGFEEITQTTQPSYFYTDFRKRVFRTRCMKKKDFPGTEREQAVNGVFAKHFGHSKPVYRIYDYGHRKWLLKSNS